MKKRIISMLTVIAMLTAFLPIISMPAMAADAWDGTTADASWYNASETSFTISTPAELAGLASLVNGGTNFKNKTIRLTDDLDLGSKEWAPIGTTYRLAFQGTFDGGGHTISNLTMSGVAYEYKGLFGFNIGTIKNLTVKDASVTALSGETEVGIICGYNYANATLFNCVSEGGTLTGGGSSTKLGVVAAVNRSTVKYCANKGTTVTSGNTSGDAGGVVCDNYGTVTGCYNTGNITGGYIVGGIVGLNSGTVSHSYNTGDVIRLYKSGVFPAAGICGSTLSEAATTYCHNYGEIADTGESYLGIGRPQTSYGLSVYGVIENCYYLNGTRDTNDSSSKKLTEGEFKSLDSFDGWETTGYWKIDTDEADYPILIPEAFYDYKINLYVYNTPDEGYIPTQTLYKNAGDYLTANDLEGFASDYTVWTTDNSDFTDTSKHKTIDENGFLVTESMDLYAVNTVKSDAENVTTGETYYAFAGTAEEFELTELLDYDAYTTDGVEFTITSGGAENKVYIDSDKQTLKIAADVDAGIYNLNIKAEKKTVYERGEIWLNSISEFENDIANFTLTVKVIDLKGNGTEETPYLIPNEDTLAYVRDKVNAADNGFVSAHYELTDNIDLNNENWTPIGTYNNKFSGTFDGKGCTISGFKIEKSGTAVGDDTMTGFFKIIGENGVVKNLTLKGEINVTITNASATGAIAGINEGTITGCHSNVNITSTGWYVGGIAGQFSSGGSSLSNTITNCYNTGSITSQSDYACAGGIVGFVGSSNLGIGYCYNTGNVSAAGTGASADSIIGLTYGCKTARNYYLEGTTSSGYGTEKTPAQFASGEVTWLMQSAQSAQAWGQNLSENGDAYPILTTDAAKKVYKVEFKKKDGAGFAKAADDAYVNNTGIAELPDLTRGDEKYTFSHWTLDTDTKAAYTAGTAVTEDIVLYAVGSENYDSEETINGITIKYNEGKTKDLSECISFADKTLSSNAFTYKITGGDFKVTLDSEVAATIDGDNLVITANNAVPVKAGAYAIEITATKKAGYGSFELLGLNNDGTVTFTVNVTVGKTAQTLTAPAASNITANSITLDEITAQGESVVKYAITTDPEANPSELTFGAGRVFTGLDVNTTYYFYAKTDGDNNYDAAVSVRADIVTFNHVHVWEYAADGDTITATCANTDRGHGEDKTETLTISAPTLTVYDGDGSADATLSTTAVGDYTTLPSVQYQEKDGDNWSNPSEAAPTDAGEYKASLSLGTYTIYVEYEIAKAEPLPGSYEIPSGISAIKGKTLSEIELPDGFAWKMPADEVNETGNYTAVFTPSDANYKSIDIEIPITVYEGSADTKSDIDAEVDVEELKEIAKEIAGETAADISLEMTVNEIDDETAAEEVKTAKTELAQAASDKAKVEYFTVTLEQTVITDKGTEKSELDSIDGMINIKIPLTAGNVNITTVTVYRYNSAAEAETSVILKEKSAAADGEEYFEVTDGYVTIHTNNFGAYAIGYDDIPTATTTPRRSSGGSSRAKATPLPSPSATPEPAETAAPENTATPMPTEEPSDWWYTDVPENAWYYEPIKAATDKGLMTGINADEFRPDFEISRAMFVTVLYRIEGEPETNLDYTFEDILRGWYYEKAVAWGSANGIIAGYSDMEFAPDDKITREQMAAVLWRYAKYKGIDGSTGGDTNILSFNDAGNITEYAIPAIGWACGENIISGYTDNTLRPLSNTTRAQVAAVLNEIDDIINR